MIEGGRLSTKRKNPLERRRDPAEPVESCADTCPVAIRNHERLDAAFRRLDEERDQAAEKHRSVSRDLKKMSDMIGERVRFQLFSWVVGILVVIFAAVLGVIWSHQGTADMGTRHNIDKLESIVTQNSKDIQVTVTRINDFIMANDQYLRRSQTDIDRILMQLDGIEKSIRTLEIGAKKE